MRGIMDTLENVTTGLKNNVIVNARGFNMASKQWNDQFNLNMDTIASYAGYAPLSKGKRAPARICATCDCEESHNCIICGFDITASGCNLRDGHCIDCWNDRLSEEHP